MGVRLAALIIAISLVSACAMDDQSATRAQGAGAGVALGAGIGALASGKTDSVLIGAVAGGLAGLAAGDAVARNKKAYAEEEGELVEERRLVADDADQIVAYNATQRERLEVLNRDIAALEADVAQGRMVRNERLDLRKRAEADLDEARQRIASVNQEIAVSRQAYQLALAERGRVDIRTWNRRIRVLERRRSVLLQLIDDLKASTERIV